MEQAPLLPPLHDTFVKDATERVGVGQATEAVPIDISNKNQTAVTVLDDGVNNILSMSLNAALPVKTTFTEFETPAAPIAEEVSVAPGTAAPFL